MDNFKSRNVISAVDPSSIDNICEPTKAFDEEKEEDEDWDNPLDDWNLA